MRSLASGIEFDGQAPIVKGANVGVAETDPAAGGDMMRDVGDMAFPWEAVWPGTWHARRETVRMASAGSRSAQRRAGVSIVGGPLLVRRFRPSLRAAALLADAGVRLYYRLRLAIRNGTWPSLGDLCNNHARDESSTRSPRSRRSGAHAGHSSRSRRVRSQSYAPAHSNYPTNKVDMG